MIVRQVESSTCMKLSGPEALASQPLILEPAGRMVEKSNPTPPPCFCVRADSLTVSKMPSMESLILFITKQLNIVTSVRFVPAFAIIRPPGRNLNPDMMP